MIRVDADETATAASPAKALRPARWRRIKPVLAVVLAAVMVGFGLGWAGRTLLVAPRVLPSADRHSVITAQEGTVERSIQLNAEATWSGGAIIPNQAEGTVTKVRLRGAGTVRSGDALYDVNLNSVRVAAGTVPAFRTLAPGARGEDVEQLQQFLKASGFPSADPRGIFGGHTRDQVKAWQRSVHRTPIGEIPLGELLFAPILPATMAPGSGVAVGKVVGRGVGAAASAEGGTSDRTGGPWPEFGITVLPATPTFSITLPQNQAGMVRQGMQVVLRRDGKTWSAVITAVGLPGADGTATASLGAADRATTICGRDCQQIPVAGDAGIEADIQIVASTKGVTVPTAALVVGPTGVAAVVAEDGTRIPVEVKASAGGKAVVEGLPAGQRIRVPGDDAG